MPADRDPALPPLRSFAIPGDGREARDALAVVTQDTIELFQLSPGSATAQPVASLTTIFEHRAITHELGAGPELPLQWFVDLDRSGSPPDVIEMSFQPPWQFAVHSRDDSATFTPAQVFDGDLRTRAESPFIRVGPITAVLLDDWGPEPTLRTLTRLP